MHVSKPEKHFFHAKTGSHIFHPIGLRQVTVVVFMELLRCLCFMQTAQLLFTPLISEIGTTDTASDTGRSNISKQHGQTNYYVLLLIHQKFRISKPWKKAEIPLSTPGNNTAYWTPNTDGTNKRALFHTQGNAVRHLSKFLHPDTSSGYLFPESHTCIGFFKREVEGKKGIVAKENRKNKLR